MAEEKKYVGYGYHGGGRKATGIKRISISISGQPEELEVDIFVDTRDRANIQQVAFCVTALSIVIKLL